MKRFLAGLVTAAIFFPLCVNSAVVGDINQDGKIDLMESIYALQVASGVYPTIDDSCLLTGQGAWEDGKEYNLCDVVTFSEITYACADAHASIAGVNEPPDPAYWTVLSIKGDTGLPGADGADCPTEDIKGLTIDTCALYELTGQPLPPRCVHVCGNGTIELSEECDDGNLVTGDGCSSNCLIEVCGNGRKDYNEECDDGNTNENDGCNSSCVIIFKRVFVTSASYSGDLGGLAGADKKCNILADVAELPGTYKAWLSDRYTSVSDRFNKSDISYRWVDGSGSHIIANNWIDLTDGNPLILQIVYDENGDQATSYPVWTNTDRYGNLLIQDTDSMTIYACSDWTDGSNNLDKSTIGYADSLSWWTEDPGTGTFTQYCHLPARLYCFEQ